MDEASARKYVESLKTVRMRVVFLVVDLEISQVPTTLGPRMDASSGNLSYVTFKGSLTKITVLGDAHQVIGTFAP